METALTERETSTKRADLLRKKAAEKLRKSKVTNQIIDKPNGKQT